MKKDEVELAVERFETRPRLLLHGCCAPCSSSVLERLTKYFDITLRYYNPNISPKEEYDKRVEELRRLLRDFPLSSPVTLDIAEWDEAPFIEIARGLEEAEEGGERCAKCYALRLRDAARLAKEGGYDYFCTTLSVSPYKNAKKLNAIGAELEKEYGVKYLTSDFKKQDGYLRSIRISRELGLYRQPYCGCEFSRRAWLKKESERAKNTAGV